MLFESDRLDEMLELQATLQDTILGSSPRALMSKARADYVRTMVLALEDELHEALFEVSWKPWAKSEFFNEVRFKEELVDVWHFFMNLMLVSGMTTHELFDGYLKKRAVNIKRQDEGYDGVTNKCPQCRRDLSESPPRVTAVRTPAPREDLHCVCGAYLGSRPIAV